MLADVRRIVCEPDYTPTNPRELCGRIFVTCYMGTENSSTETRSAANALAEQIGRYILFYIYLELFFFIWSAIKTVLVEFLLAKTKKSFYSNTKLSTGIEL